MIVERSGNHCHLTEDTFYGLFESTGTIKRHLLNKAHFVFEERIGAFGLELPILGPFRKYNQIEISRSEDVARGWPLAESGDKRHIIDDVLVNIYPAGRYCSIGTSYIKDVICIVSVPHVHIPSPTKSYKKGSIKIGNFTIDNSPVYFDPSIDTPTIHLDNDVYNACNSREGNVSIRCEAGQVRYTS